MKTVTYKRGDRVVVVDENKLGTRKVLEAGGFKLQKEPKSAEKAGIPANIMEALGAAFDSPEAVREASDEELLAIDGIGEKMLKRIREQL